MRLVSGAGYLDGDLPILTTKGWIKAERLREGLIVYDTRGHLAKVTFVEKKREKKRIYRVSFKDGEYIEGTGQLQLCHINDKDHKFLSFEKWKLNNLLDEAKLVQKLKKVPMNVALDPLAYKCYQKLEWKRFINLFDLNKRFLYVDFEPLKHHVPSVIPEPFPGKAQKIHPYILGVWLVNGWRKRPVISTVKHKIKRKFAALGYELIHTRSCYYRIPDVNRFFRYYNLFDQKRIPYCYKYGNYKERAQLIEGIVDGVGKGQKLKTVTLVDPILVKDLREMLFALNITIKTDEFTPPPNGDIVYRKRHLTTFKQPTFESLTNNEKYKVKQNIRRWFKISSCDCAGSTKKQIGIVISSNEHAFLAGHSLVPVKDNHEYLDKRYL